MSSKPYGSGSNQSELHPSEDVEYWMSRTPEERIAEVWRQSKLKYGIDDSVRLDRSAFEVIDLSRYEELQTSSNQRNESDGH